MPAAPTSATAFSNSQERPAASADYDSRLGRMGRANKGRTLSLSHKQAISRARTDVPLSEDHKQAVSKGMKEAHRKNPELAAASSRRMLGVPKTAERKKKISDTLKGTTKPLAVRVEISKSVKAGPKRPINFSKKGAGTGQCNCPCGCTVTESSRWVGAGVRQQCSGCYQRAGKMPAGCTCTKL